VIGRFLSAKRAVPTLMAGMALFIAACQPKPPSPVRVEATRPDPLVLAESYAKQGELEKALEAYGVFLKDAPKNERSALALRRISEIYLKLNDPAKALTTLERICQEYPDLAWIPDVQYEIAQILSRIGEHRRSATEALSWLDKYPHHPLKRDLYLLLGEDFSALGDKVEAFHWWLMAKSLWADDSEQAAQLDRKLSELITSSGPTLLTQFAREAEGSSYAPKIYHRMAQIHLDQGERKEAERASTALIHSTTDDVWVSKGKALLERLAEEKAVKQGVLGVPGGPTSPQRPVLHLRK